MTTYGTIPTTPPPPSVSSDPDFVRLAKERIKSGLGTRRPWMDMFLVPAFSLPPSVGEAFHRMGANIMFYRMNYVIGMLFILFLGLLWQPASMIFFIIMMFAWLFLYFLRDETLVVYGHEVNDRIVSLVLSVVTVFGLLVTNAKENIVISLFVGALAVLVHAVLREGEDHIVAVEDDDGVRSGGDLPVKAPVTLPLKHPASSSYSLSQ